MSGTTADREYTAAQLNELFKRRVRNPEEREKLAEYGGAFIRDRLREAAFCRLILPPRRCKRSELQISMSHDTLVKIVFVEPKSRAMSFSFRSQTDAKYYRADRFEVPFFEVGSERFEKSEEELEVYPFNLTDVIRKNLVRDIGEVEDHVFLGHVESAVQSMQKEKNSIAFTADFLDNQAFTAFNVNAGNVREHGKFKAIDVLNNSAAANAAAGVTEDLYTPMQKDDLIKLFKAFPGRGLQGSRLRCHSFLVSEYDFEEINGWSISDVGDDILKETTYAGWKSDRVIGRKFIKTIKTDTLRPGNIYAFAAPEFVGGFLIWNDIKFYTDMERNRISMEAWENIGMYLANVAGVRKLELYAGSSDQMDSGATSNATILADFAPVDEDDLGTENNLVAEGQTFPQVVDF